MRKVRMTLEFTLDSDMMNWLQEFDTGIPVTEWNDNEICDTFADNLDLVIEDCLAEVTAVNIISN